LTAHIQSACGRLPRGATIPNHLYSGEHVGGHNDNGSSSLLPEEDTAASPKFWFSFMEDNGKPYESYFLWLLQPERKVVVWDHLRSTVSGPPGPYLSCGAHLDRSRDRTYRRDDDRDRRNRSNSYRLGVAVSLLILNVGGAPRYPDS